MRLIFYVLLKSELEIRKIDVNCLSSRRYKIKSRQKKTASRRLKNTKKKLNDQSKVVGHTFTRSSIKKYSDLETVAKHKNKQGEVNMKIHPGVYG